MRYVFISILLIFALLGFSSCSTIGGNESGEASGHVMHVVVCWLKEPGNPAARTDLIQTSKEFSQIPGVIEVSAGDVLPGKRPGLDSSFDVAVVIKFKDEQALRNYEIHPIHQTAVKNKLIPLVKKFFIYDFIVK